MILKDKTPSDIHVLTHRAFQVIQARDSAIKRKHADRMAQLKEIMCEISSLEDKQGDADLIPGTQLFSLSPERERLILNPLEGL